MKFRKFHTRKEAPRNLMPMSEVWKRMVKNIDERYYEGEHWLITVRKMPTGFLMVGLEG